MAEPTDTTTPSRRSILSRIGALPALFGGGIAAQSGAAPAQATALNRPYHAVEAAYAIAQYVDFDPRLWLQLAEKAGAPIDTADGMLAILYQGADQRRARFLTAWLNIEDAAISQVVSLLDARRAREHEESLDPIFMAIDVHRDARRKMVALRARAPDDDAQFDAAEDHETALFDKFVTVEPNTIVGAAAFAEYVADYPRDEMKPDNAYRALRTLHSALLEMHAAHVEA